MKKILHLRFTAIIAKPIFFASILLWSFFMGHVIYRLVTGHAIGESISGEVKRNGIEMGVHVLFIMLCLAFIRMSWQGLRYWPQKYPKFQFDLNREVSAEDDKQNRHTRSGKPL